VPTAHVAGLRKELVDVVLVCDRYSAYPCLAKGCDDLILASCWAHVRRDLLKAARSWPELESWMFAWVADIRTLSRLNAARREVWEERVPLDHQSPAFVACHRDLETKLCQMHARCEAHLQEPGLDLAKQKVLNSLRNHLCCFPQTPIDCPIALSRCSQTNARSVCLPDRVSIRITRCRSIVPDYSQLAVVRS
jgi:hypothetical protein